MRFTKIVLSLAVTTVLVVIAATAGTARSAATHSNVTTITFWHAYAENASAPELQRLTKIVIPRFEHLNPGIRVQQVPFSYGNLQQKLTTSVAGGTLPDVIRADLAWVPQYAKLGAFAGSFSVEATETVCDASLDAIASLVDKSLVRR